MTVVMEAAVADTVVGIVGVEVDRIRETAVEGKTGDHDPGGHLEFTVGLDRSSSENCWLVGIGTGTQVPYNGLIDAVFHH